MTDPAVAMVVGCNGQDGTFLCRELVRRGYSVIGVGKQAEQLSRLGQRFRYHALDLARGTSALSALVESARPDRVFHLAAVHASAARAQYEALFPEMLAVNVASLHAILEYLRLHNPAGRVLYASSSKVFGAPLPAAISDDTPRSSSCLYSLTKNAAGDLVRYYRQAHGSVASQLYLFNHESDLRPANFFIPKLVRTIVASLHGEPPPEQFQTLDFYCDWGSAAEYMEIAVDCLEQAPGEDFLLASGRCLHAQALLEGVTAACGATVPGGMARDGVAHQGAYQVDLGKLRRMVGRVPHVRIETLIQEMVQQRLSERSRETV